MCLLYPPYQIKKMTLKSKVQGHLTYARLIRYEVSIFLLDQKTLNESMQHAHIK